MTIVLDQVTKRYGQQAVVSRVQLAIGAGESFVLLGPSGSGKSTVLRLIAGLTPLDEGRILLGGHDVTLLPPQQRTLGFVFQNYALFQHMTVAENIEFALVIRRQAATQRRRRRNELLSLIGLTSLADRYPRQLSGGQQQRVALARALAHQPAVLLLDEPFGALDARVRTELRRNLRTILKELALTTIFVTHDQEEGFELADRIGVMAGGRLLEVGSPAELYQHPQTEFVATFLGTVNVAAGRCDATKLTVGPMSFPLHANPGAASRVRVVFRPEDVVLGAEASDLDCPVLGAGVVREMQFAGAFERLRLELPAQPDISMVGPSLIFGQSGMHVDVLRTPAAARQLPLCPGDTAWVGVRSIHALVHPGLRIGIVEQHGGAALTLGGELARAAQANTTVFTPLSTEAEQRLHQALGTGINTLRIVPLHTNLLTDIRADSEAMPLDLLVLDGGTPGALEQIDQALNAGVHHVLVVPPGVFSISNALIAVAGGESGQDDIWFAGRVLRHLGVQTTLVSVLPNGGDPGVRTQRAEFLAAGARTLGALGVLVERRLLTGDVEPALRDCLHAISADLLVVGAPLASTPTAVVLHGVTASLLRQMPAAAVLIVRSALTVPV